MKLTNSWLYFEVNELHGRTGFFARHRFAHAQITLFVKLDVGRAKPRLKQLSGAGKSMIAQWLAAMNKYFIDPRPIARYGLGSAVQSTKVLQEPIQTT